MPRRKKLPKIPDLIDIGQNPDTHIVQKTNPLLTLSETSLTLAEFKILDAYLARIDSHNPDERFVRMEKGAIEKYLGVTQIKPSDLEKRIDNLFQTITIRDEDKPYGFTKIALFEKAVCYQDEDGLWQIDLGASASAMEYIFYPENLGYLRYRLKNIVDLTSRYSYILYLYLENNRFRHSWEISLSDLKSLLQCTAERYSQFKFFNAEILKKCQKELCEKTDCHFTYEPLKKGRTVKFIRFTIQSRILEIDYDPDQITLEQYQQSLNTNREFWESTLEEFSFSAEQIAEIREILIVIPDSLLPESPVLHDDIELRRYHYMQIKAAEIKRRNADKPIKNKFAYLLKMLKQDAGKAK